MAGNAELHEVPRRTSTVHEATGIQDNCGVCSPSRSERLLHDDRFSPEGDNSRLSLPPLVVGPVTLPVCPNDLVTLDPTDPNGTCAFRCEVDTMFTRVWFYTVSYDSLSGSLRSFLYYYLHSRQRSSSHKAGFLRGPLSMWSLPASPCCRSSSTDSDSDSPKGTPKNAYDSQ